MNKYIKRFSVMFVMSLIVVLGYCVSAFAVDDYTEIGKVNFNNTLNNSATVGDQLFNPEKGWKRYDDYSKNISYTDAVSYYNPITTSFYASSYHVFDTSYTNTSKEMDVKFNFSGTKLRLITNMYRDDVNVTVGKISFDGGRTFEDFSNKWTKNQTTAHICLAYEKTGLTNELHNVVIKYYRSGNLLFFDALDIDADGYISPYTDPIDQSITLNKSALDLNIEADEQLIATTTPSSAQVTWSSSDPSIATVDAQGKVIGVKAGQATITAQITGTNITATCTVNVTSVPSVTESITLDKTSGFVEQGNQIQLNATTTPAGAKVIWASSDTSVATVDSNGLVTVPERDTYTRVTITAQIEGTDKKASCELIITYYGDYVLN